LSLGFWHRYIKSYFISTWRAMSWSGVLCSWITPCTV